MDEVVKVELVDFARVELREAVTHALEQCSQLFLVICGYQFPGRSTLCLVT